MKLNRLSLAMLVCSPVYMNDLDLVRIYWEFMK